MAGSAEERTIASPASKSEGEGGPDTKSTKNTTTTTDTDTLPTTTPTDPSDKTDSKTASPHALDALHQPRPTTAVSSIDIQTLTFPDGSRGTFSSGVSGSGPAQGPSIVVDAAGPGSVSTGSEIPIDAMSILSLAPTAMRPPAAGDLASLAAGGGGDLLQRKSRAWSMLREQAASVQPFARARTARVPYDLGRFYEEFEGEEEEEEDAEGKLNDAEGGGHKKKDDAEGGGQKGQKGQKDEERLAKWKAKLKHYMILSSAGKPIWSRHGDLSLVNGYMGVVQTILSFYEGEDNPLRSFTAGPTRFVVVTEGPLYLVAISRLGESDAQLRDQLRALYMQILSTLTLPTLTRIFAHRPSTDLRMPLQGTEGLLAALADSFTRGSPSMLLGALECLRLRKSQRAAITNVFLRQRSASSSSSSSSSSSPLLYGLLVAGGKLVSVVRPRRHSLHPSDLQLIFNMLFASGAVQAGGGENWIPLCLPAFNNQGYLYMYVSFFDEPTEANQRDNQRDHQRDTQQANEAIAIILISADKESFFALKEMRDKVALHLAKNGSLALVRAALAAGRPKVVDIVKGPGSAVQIRHFLYKSRANVQFCMAEDLGYGGNQNGGNHEEEGGSRNENEDNEDSRNENKNNLESQRRLMTLYHQLHAAAHARHAHLKVLHCVGEDATSLAWITPVFEFYCVAGPNASRTVVTQEANRIIQWAKREEERLFIIGGGVF